MVIHKEDFADNPKLRRIDFYETTIESMEPGTFMNLPDLQYLTRVCEGQAIYFQVYRSSSSFSLWLWLCMVSSMAETESFSDFEKYGRDLSCW